MTSSRVDNYQVAEVPNVTATPNVSTNAVNRIVINTLDELLSTDDTRTTPRYLLVAIVIYLLLCSTVGALYATLFESDESENDIVQSRLN